MKTKNKENQLTENKLDLIKMVGLAQLTMNQAEVMLEKFPRAKVSIYQPAKNIVNKYEKQLNEIYNATGIDTHEIIHRFVCDFEENFKITVVD